MDSGVSVMEFVRPPSPPDHLHMINAVFHLVKKNITQAQSKNVYMCFHAHESYRLYFMTI